MANLLTSIFTFKKETIKVFCKENIGLLCEEIKKQIIERVNEQITGAEKKAKVDAYIIDFIEAKFHSENVIVQFVIDKLVEAVPMLTQFVYDYLKKHISGLTESEVQ